MPNDKFNKLVKKYTDKGWDSLSDTEKAEYRSYYSNLVVPNEETGTKDAVEMIQPAVVEGKRLPYGSSFLPAMQRDVVNPAMKYLGYVGETLSTPFAPIKSSVKNYGGWGVLPPVIAYNAIQNYDEILPSYITGKQQAQTSDMFMTPEQKKNNPQLAGGIDLVTGFLEPSLGIGPAAKVAKNIAQAPMKAVMNPKNFKNYYSNQVVLNPKWNPYNPYGLKSNVAAAKKAINDAEKIELPPAPMYNTSIGAENFNITSTDDLIKNKGYINLKKDANVSKQETINSIIEKFDNPPSSSTVYTPLKNKPPTLEFFQEKVVDRLINDPQFTKHFDESANFDVIKKRALKILKDANKNVSIDDKLSPKELAYLVTRDPEILKYTTANNPLININTKVKDIPSSRLAELKANKSGLQYIDDAKNIDKTYGQVLSNLEHPIQIKSLSPKEIMVMDRYTKGYDSKMNAFKRKGDISGNKTFKEAIIDDVDVLTEGIKKNKFLKDTELYRGVRPFQGEVITSSGQKVNKLIPDEMEVGDIFTEKGFISTSVNPHALFPGSKMKIHAPGGKQSHVYPNWYPSSSQFPKELESLLPPGLQLQKLKDGSFKILNPYMMTGIASLGTLGTLRALKTSQQYRSGGKVGLWANIHAKRERIKQGSGEKMRKPGSKGAPTDEAIKRSQAKFGMQLPVEPVEPKYAAPDEQAKVVQGIVNDMYGAIAPDLYESYHPSFLEVPNMAVNAAKSYLKDKYNSPAYQKRLMNEINESKGVSFLPRYLENYSDKSYTEGYQTKYPDNFNSDLVYDYIMNSRLNQLDNVNSMNAKESYEFGKQKDILHSARGASYNNYTTRKLPEKPLHPNKIITGSKPQIWINPLDYGIQFQKNPKEQFNTALEEVGHSSLKPLAESPYNTNSPHNNSILAIKGTNTITPYAHKVVRDNTVFGKDDYYFNTDEVIQKKRALEYDMENAPEGTFKKPFKYGDDVGAEHFNYFLEKVKAGENQPMHLFNGIFGEDVDVNKLDLKTRLKGQKRFQNIMNKIAMGNMQQQIPTAKYGMALPVEPAEDKKDDKQKLSSSINLNIPKFSRSKKPLFQSGFWMFKHPDLGINITGHNSDLNLIDTKRAGLTLNNNVVLNRHDLSKSMFVNPGIKARYNYGNTEFGAKASFGTPRPEYNLSIKRNFKQGGAVEPTKLSKNEEAAFQEWRKSLPKNLQADDEMELPIEPPFKTKLSKNEEAAFQEWRQSLPVNLQSDTEMYDLRGAYKAGLQPELIEGNYRLGSRDPESGLILKNPLHPTYDKTLNADINLGYMPSVNIKTGRTYTKGPTEFAMNPTNLYNNGGVANPYMQQGGMVPVEIEKEERVYKKNSDGSYEMIYETGANAPSHEEGGVKMELPEGSLIFPKKYYKDLDFAMRHGGENNDWTLMEMVTDKMKRNAKKAYLEGKPYSSGGAMS